MTKMTTDLEAQAFSYSSILLERDKFLELLLDIDAKSDASAFKRRVSALGWLSRLATARVMNGLRPL